MALGIRDRSSTSSRRWSGWSPRTLPVQPINRLVVSLPAEASTLTKVRISSRVRRRTVPVSSSNSACMQLGHEVVGGVFDAPVDVLAEERVVGELSLAVAHAACRARGAASSSARAADRLLVLLGDPEQHADHPHGHLGAEIGDEVEAVGAHERIEDLGAVLRGSAARGRSSSSGVKTRESTPRWAVCMGGSSMMKTPLGGMSMSALIDLEDPAAGRAERLVVDEAPLDVVEPAQRIEVVAPRCSTAAPLPAAAGTPGRGRRGSSTS